MTRPAATLAESSRHRELTEPWAAKGATSARIENYLGFPAGLSGSYLAPRARLQAAKFGRR
jgi:thioredoxin reductase (NADPH)